MSVLCYYLLFRFNCLMSYFSHFAIFIVYYKIVYEKNKTDLIEINLIIKQRAIFELRNLTIISFLIKIFGFICYVCYF